MLQVQANPHARAKSAKRSLDLSAGQSRISLTFAHIAPLPREHKHALGLSARLERTPHMHDTEPNLSSLFSSPVAAS